VIDGAIGEGSPFEDQFGYYAQGVDSTTCTLPDGWRERLVRLQSQNTDGKVGFCLEVTDLFIAKCVANREKDRDFNIALLKHGFVNPSEAMSRISSLPVNDQMKSKVEAIINRLSDEAGLKNQRSPAPR